MFTKITFTGADDSVTPKDLIDISAEYPNVEWGILVSRNYTAPRFPSSSWIEEFISIAPANLPISMHLCGTVVQNLLRYGTTIGNSLIELPFSLIYRTNRIQINTHGQIHLVDSSALLSALKGYPSKEFIFQMDGVNEHLGEFAVAHNIKTSCLFDMSHGDGTSPEAWPTISPNSNVFSYGYAGGLGPENIEIEAKRICKAANSFPYPFKDFWIDMETKVRSNSNKTFDLSKVRHVLETLHSLSMTPRMICPEIKS